MGSTGWTHFVPYQASIAKALQELQEEVRRTGEFAGGFEGVGDSDDLLGILEANESEGTQGTHSVLDIFGGISDEPQMFAASPLDKEMLVELFGTTMPSREQVEEKDLELNEPIERWQARYLIIYRDGKPSEICFTGNTGD